MNSNIKTRVELLIEQLDKKIKEYEKKKYNESSMKWEDNPLCSSILIKKCCQIILESDSSNDQTIQILLLKFEPKAFASIRRHTDEENNIPPTQICNYIKNALQSTPKKFFLFNSSKLTVSLDKFVQEVNQINNINDVIKIRGFDGCLQYNHSSV